MVWWVILGTLAAFGALSILWVLFGHFLPGRKGMVAVYLGADVRTAVRRHRWLRDLGLVRSALIVVDTPGPECPGVEYVELAALAARLEQERSDFGGTGIGDHSRRRRGGGLS